MTKKSDTKSSTLSLNSLLKYDAKINIRGEGAPRHSTYWHSGKWHSAFSIVIVSVMTRQY